MTEPDWLRAVQYSSNRNLSSRIALHERFGVSGIRWQRWVFDRLGLPGDARVLEVGAGTGALWRENEERIPETWRVTLTDLSEGMLASARGAVPARFRLLVADAQELPFADAAFDAVIANHMLYHVPEPRRALREFQRVLAPGGRLYATTNGRAHLRELDDLMAPHIASDERNTTAETFGIETGGPQLEAAFARVELHRLRDELHIDDPAAVASYAESILGDRSSAVDAIENEARRVVERDGILRVGKDSGLFVCS